jgi:hypothetical protein
LVKSLRLIRPAIEFWVDVRWRRFGQAWMVAADLASSPEVGVACRLDVAALLAFMAPWRVLGVRSRGVGFEPCLGRAVDPPGRAKIAATVMLV